MRFCCCCCFLILLFTLRNLNIQSIFGFTNCCRWIFVQGCNFGGEVPEEQKLRGRAPDVSAVSPHHQGSNHQGRRELGLSEIAFAPAPARIVGGGPTKDGARLITRSAKRRKGPVKTEGSTRWRPLIEDKVRMIFSPGLSL